MTPTTLNPVERHPNATTNAVVGAVLTLAFYVAASMGWNPPAEIIAAITTLVLTLVVALGPLVKYQRKHKTT